MSLYHTAGRDHLLTRKPTLGRRAKGLSYHPIPLPKLCPIIRCRFDLRWTGQRPDGVLRLLSPWHSCQRLRRRVRDMSPVRSYPQHYTPYDAVGCCVNSFQQFQQRRSHVRPPLGLQLWPDFARGSTPHQQNRVLANLNCRSKLPPGPRPKVPPTTLHCCPSQIPLLHGKARQAGLHPRKPWFLRRCTHMHTWFVLARVWRATR